MPGALPLWTGSVMMSRCLTNMCFSRTPLPSSHPAPQQYPVLRSLTNGLLSCIHHRYSKEWEVTVKRLGRWIDFENDYKTLDPQFMESVWWVIYKRADVGRISAVVLQSAGLLHLYFVWQCTLMAVPCSELYLVSRDTLCLCLSTEASG